MLDYSDKINFIELRLIDIFGNLRGMTLAVTKPVDTLEELLNDPILTKGVNVDGSSLPGFAKIENSDLHLTPDPNTLIEVVYQENRKAACLCFLYNRSQESDSETPFLGDSRSLLKKTCEELLPGLILKIKPEPEFYLLEIDEESNITPLDLGKYIQLAPEDKASEMMMDISSSLQAMGVDVYYFHHEVGPAQNEFEINFNEVLKNCDSLAIFKPTVKALAEELGITASFMPKPFTEASGSGLHFHMQLWEGEKNLFASESKTGEVSDLGRWFIGGLMEHAPAITAIANPSINSFKRLVPGHEAPVLITWGYRNRSTLVRVPLFRDPAKAAIEYRAPDFTTNPYLLLTVLIHAGMDGVKKKIEPPKCREDDVCQLTEKELKQDGIQSLPTSLGEALDILEKEDPIILNALGPHIGPAWLKIKRKEWVKWNQTVTDWDITNYLDC